MLLPELGPPTHTHMSRTSLQTVPSPDFLSNIWCFVSNMRSIPTVRPRLIITLVCFVFLLVPQHAAGPLAYHSLSLSYVCGCLCQLC